MRKKKERICVWLLFNKYGLSTLNTLSHTRRYKDTVTHLVETIYKYRTKQYRTTVAIVLPFCNFFYFYLFTSQLNTFLFFLFATFCFSLSLSLSLTHTMMICTMYRGSSSRSSWEVCKYLHFVVESGKIGEREKEREREKME